MFWIRCLSHVSTQFRTKLGDIIWANVQLTTYSNQTLWYIPKFLEDRPLVRAGIEHLHISIDIRDRDDGEEFKISDPVGFENFMQTHGTQTSTPNHVSLLAYE